MHHRRAARPACRHSNLAAGVAAQAAAHPARLAASGHLRLTALLASPSPSRPVHAQALPGGSIPTVTIQEQPTGPVPYHMAMPSSSGYGELRALVLPQFGGSSSMASGCDVMHHGCMQMSERARPASLWWDWMPDRIVCPQPTSLTPEPSPACTHTHTHAGMVTTPGPFSSPFAADGTATSGLEELVPRSGSFLQQAPPVIHAPGPGLVGAPQVGALPGTYFWALPSWPCAQHCAACSMHPRACACLR